MITIKTKGVTLGINVDSIATIKASQIGKDEFIPILETLDYKTIALDLVGSPFATNQDCLQAVIDYIDQGGEQ